VKLPALDDSYRVSALSIHHPASAFMPSPHPMVSSLRPTRFPFKASLRWLSAVCALLLAGCAARVGHEEMGLNGQQVLQKGEFTVRFVAGPDRIEDGQHRKCSFYQVARWNEERGFACHLGVESAIGLWHFQSDAKARPEDCIKLFVSPSGRTLLIEEDVPNDCAPCWNHIVVRWEDQELLATFLDLPERVTKQTEVFGHTPRVTGITDDEVSYQYADGIRVAERFSQRVKAEQRPTPPG
jgi:hypothetical protein